MKNDLFEVCIEEEFPCSPNVSLMDSPKNNNIDFSEIYLKYYCKLMRFAAEFVAFEEDAKDIIQDVFVNLWERKDSFTYIQNVNAYVFRLTRNKCIDYLKHRIIQDKYVANIQSAYEQELYLKLQSLEEFDVNIVFGENLDKIIARAINSLPGRCREIFLLSRYEGLKYKEISGRLNLSINTIETQMSIALRKLRRELKSYLSA